MNNQFMAIRTRVCISCLSAVGVCSKTMCQRILQLRWAIFAATLLALAMSAFASDPNAYRLFAVKTDTDDVVEINRTNGAVTAIFKLPFDANSASGFDYNPADGFLYVAHPKGVGVVGLYRIDLVAKTATEMKTISGTGDGSTESIGFKNDGNVYVYDERSAFSTGTLYLFNWATSTVQSLGTSGTPSMLGGDYDESRNVFWASDEWNAKVYQLSVQNSSVVWTSTSTWYQGNGPGAVMDMDVAPNGDVLIAATDDGPGVSRILKMDAAAKTWSTLHTISGTTDYRIATIPDPACDLTAPVISHTSPATGDVSMSAVSNTIFQVYVYDPEDATLTYSWTWDGQRVSGNASSYTNVAGWSNTGVHQLRCYVSDDLWSEVVFAEWTVEVLEDYDGDEMPDEWEVKYFLDLSRDGWGDFDGDGVSDSEEYFWGTNPTVWPASVTSSSMPSGMEMVPYSVTLQATNGLPPYTWRIAPNIATWGKDILGLGSPPASACNVLAISAGAYHNLALLSGGTVVGWGVESRATPPPGLSTAVAISAGGYHSLALRSDGTVMGWGDDDCGQATPPPGLSNVVAIAGGNSYSLALLSDGTVRGWGSDSSGQATPPPGLSNVVAIAAGCRHSLAVLDDGTVVGWGVDWMGGEALTTPPPGLSNVVAIAAGWSHSLALKSDGTVIGWGDGVFDKDYAAATPPPGLSNVVAIAAGSFHSLALKSDGTVVGWGRNSAGQSTPPQGMTHAMAIAASDGTSLALLQDSYAKLPDGLTCSVDGIVSGTPILATTNRISVIVRDSDGAEAPRAFDLAIAPNPNTRPVIDQTTIPPGSLNVGEDTSQLFSVTAHDPEGQSLTYVWTLDGQSVGSDSPSYSYMATWGTAGTHVLRCYVSDDLWAGVVYVQWIVTVLADNDGDGMPNAQEKDLGRDPNDPADGGAPGSMSGSVAGAGIKLAGAYVELRGLCNQRKVMQRVVAGEMQRVGKWGAKGPRKG